MSTSTAFAIAGVVFIVALCAACGAVVGAMGEVMGAKPWLCGALAGSLSCVLLLSVFAGDDA